MNEDFKNNITYDDDWKSVSTAEYAKVYEDESELAENEKTDYVNKKVKKNNIYFYFLEMLDSLVLKIKLLFHIFLPFSLQIYLLLFQF